jgi:hypothetical protein
MIPRATSLSFVVLALQLAFAPGETKAQADEMAVITVRNRPAQDLVEVLRKVAGSNGSVVAMNDRLVIRAAPSVMPSLRKLVAELDVAPRSLLITVRRQGTSSHRASSIEAGGAVSTGGVTVTTTGDGVRAGVTSKETRTSRVVVGGAMGSSALDGTSGALQQVQVLEGQRAFIGTGVETPAVVTGGAWPRSIGGQSAVSGFDALPRVAGDLVTVEIWVSDDQMAPGGRMRTNRLSTTLAGRLDEWLSLGGVDRSTSTSSSEPLARDRQSSSTTSSLELRVQLLP